MSGGNAHQRAIERSASKRVQKQVEKEVYRYLTNKTTDAPPAIPKKEQSWVRKFIGWEGFSFVTLSFVGIAFLTVPHGYTVSRLCFIGAATSLVLKLSLQVEGTKFTRLTVAILASVVAGILVNRVNDWVTSLQVEQNMQDSSQRVIVVHPPKPKHLYELDINRKAQFRDSIEKPKSKGTIRVGCDDRSEESCLAAAQFLLAISEAGWPIDSNKVFRLQQTIPKVGVAITYNDPNAAKYTNLSAYQGFWHPMTATETTFLYAFRALGISTNGADDSSLANGETGIYFGPEPEQ